MFQQTEGIRILRGRVALAAYSIVSIILSRIFLKEKITLKTIYFGRSYHFRHYRRLTRIIKRSVGTPTDLFVYFLSNLFFFSSEITLPS